MVTYSHSRVSAYEQCPYKYKLQYIDRITPEIQNTIEAFMGDIVHRTLEKLYKDKKFKKELSKSILLKYYNDLWNKEFSDDILIVKKDLGLTQENYKKMGFDFIENYYNRMKPFDQLIILDLETQDRMTLSDGNQWHVRIDKFACDNEGNYYVCDYKTNSRMKDQQEADSDRQLAMYSLWVRDKFKDAKSVKLVWHMLAFNKDVISERTEEQLEKLQQEVVEKIKEIENAKEFSRNVNLLCDYCGFKGICPSFKHKIELETKKNVREFKDDDGIRIINELAEIKPKKKELEEKEEILKKELIAFAKQKGIDVVYGSNMKASVRDCKKVILPEDKESLIKAIKEKGLWDELSMLNYPRFSSLVKKGEIDKEILEMIEISEDSRISLSKIKDWSIE